ncbi:MAG: hypothetical protein PHC34_13355, partial [Candidatus Gastranaerophilales bacterium]|nr:hypothetical protein [Candidatus Gastranaerophilales bacterium]
IFPELVMTDNKGFKAIEYGKLSALLVKGVKELNDKNEKLKADNTELKAKNIELSNKIDLIEQRLNKIEEMKGISYSQKKENIFERFFNWIRSLFKSRVMQIN